MSNKLKMGILIFILSGQVNGQQVNSQVPSYLFTSSDDPLAQTQDAANAGAGCNAACYSALMSQNAALQNQNKALSAKISASNSGMSSGSGSGFGGNNVGGDPYKTACINQDVDNQKAAAKLYSECKKIDPSLTDNYKNNPDALYARCQADVSACTALFNQRDKAIQKKILDTSPKYPDPTQDTNTPYDPDTPLANKKASTKTASLNDPIKCPTEEDYKAAQEQSTSESEDDGGGSTTIISGQPPATDKPTAGASGDLDTNAHVGDSQCMALKAQDKVNVLATTEKEASKDLKEDMTTLNKTEEKLGEKEAQCNNQNLNLNAQIAAKQTDLKAASAEEMTALQGLNTNLDQTMSNIQAQIDAAIAKETEINGPDMTQAYNAYQQAISAALTTCEHNLVTQGQHNQLTYTGGLNQAIAASGVGITTYKCNQDFDTQQARYLALQALNQKKQALQVQFLQMQNQIAQLTRQAAIEKSKLSIENQKLLTGFTMRMTQDQQQIATLSQSLQASQASCSQAFAIGQQQAARDVDDAQQEAPTARESFCQLQHFKRNNVVPDKSSSPDTDDFKAVSKALRDDVPVTLNQACPKGGAAAANGQNGGNR